MPLGHHRAPTRGGVRLRLVVDFKDEAGLDGVGHRPRDGLVDPRAVGPGRATKPWASRRASWSVSIRPALAPGTRASIFSFKPSSRRASRVSPSRRSWAMGEVERGEFVRLQGQKVAQAGAAQPPAAGLAGFVLESLDVRKPHLQRAHHPLRGAPRAAEALLDLGKRVAGPVRRIIVARSSNWSALANAIVTCPRTVFVAPAVYP